LTGIEIINTTDVAATFPPTTTAEASSLQPAVGFLGLFAIGHLLLL